VPCQYISELRATDLSLTCCQRFSPVHCRERILVIKISRTIGCVDS